MNTSADNNSVVVRNTTRLPIAVRPSDVTRTTGSLHVLQSGVTITTFQWLPDVLTGMDTPRMPSVCYRASTPVATHNGAMLFNVHGVPPDASSHGFVLEMTVMGPRGGAAFTFDVDLVMPLADGTQTNVWGHVKYSGQLSVQAFPTPTASSVASPPPQTIAVVLSGTPSNPVTTDAGSLPPFPAPLSGTTSHSAMPVYVCLKGTSVLPYDLHIVSMRFVLIPPSSS